LLQRVKELEKENEIMLEDIRKLWEVNKNMKARLDGVKSKRIIVSYGGDPKRINKNDITAI
jgi:hypothetical protein